MSSKILESDEVDSKYFRQAFGRIFTQIAELRSMISNQGKFLESAFHVPPNDFGFDDDRRYEEGDLDE